MCMCFHIFSYSCLEIQLLEEMPCDKFSTNYTVKMLHKIKSQALVNKEKEIYGRIIWNSEITSEILEKA